MFADCLISYCLQLFQIVFILLINIVKGSYIRVGEGGLPMTAYEVYSYETFRKRVCDDLRQVADADMRLFNRDRLSVYLLRVKNDRKINRADAL